jgi:hypothetical protein
VTAEPQRFVFAPLEQRGVIAGLRAGQIVVLGGALVAGTVVLRSFPDVAGVVLAALLVVAAAAVAFVSVAGRPVEQWAPTVARRMARLATGETRTATGRRAGLAPVPTAFSALVFDEVARPADTPVGVIRDLRSGTLTAVIATRGRSFALLDDTEKARRLASWSALMAGLAREGGAVRTLQWVERTVPGDAEALVRHYERERTIEADSAAARSYADLVAEAGPVGLEHECFVALSVGGHRRRPGVEVLLRELRLLEGQLGTADIEVDHVLSPRGIGALLRTAFDPWARVGIGRRAALHPDLEGPLPETAWPASADEGWSAWRTDDTWHATFWVAEWPRSDVTADFLTPLLLQSGGQRTIALVMAPLPPSAGVREAEAARTAQAADDQLRQRAGFLSTARRRREAEGVLRREAELSDGHAAYRFSGYVTVSARSQDDLEVACGEVLQAGHQSRLELRLLHGAQDVAFVWTLPFGRGLSGR